MVTQTEKAPRRYFPATYLATTTMIAVVLTLAGLGALHYAGQISELDRLSTEKKKNIANAFSRSFWPQLASHYNKIDYSKIDDKKLEEASRPIDLAVKFITQGISIKDFRVILPKGRIIYSLSGQSQGATMPMSAGLATALHEGSAYTDIKKEAPGTSKKSSKALYISESFFPIRGRSNQVEAVLQILDDVTIPVEQVKKSLLYFIGPTLIILLVFLGSVTAFAANADRIIATQRKVLEESAKQHKKSKETFRAIADYSYGLELWIGADKKILWINPAVQRLIGNTAHHAMETKNYLLSVAHGEDRENLAYWIDDAVTGGHNDAVEFRVKTVGGNVTWVAASYQPIRSADDAFLGSRWSIQDISERKSMEEALRASELRFRTVASSAADAIVCINDLGKLTFWNPAAQTFFGYTEKEILGKSAENLVPERFRNTHSKGLACVAKSGESPVLNKVIEMIGQRANGEEFPIELAVSPGKIKGQSFYIGVIRDITARTEAKKNLQNTLDVLTRANAELEHFAFVAAHDLQEPSRSIISFCQLLERRLDGAIDPKAKEFLGYVVQDAKRMRALVHDLLIYTSVGRKDAPFSPIDMKQALDQVKENLASQIAERRVQIVSGDLPETSGNAAQVIQLLQNLITNAIKFTPKDRVPKIKISGIPSDGDCAFTIIDNGIGIEDEYLTQIFAPFKRLHAVKKYPGSGIGLAVCQRIVERHGGRIWAESVPKGGAAFHFTLPRSDAS